MIECLVCGYTSENKDNFEGNICFKCIQIFKYESGYYNE